MIDALIATLRASTVVQDGLGGFTADALSALLADMTLWTAVGASVSG